MINDTFRLTLDKIIDKKPEEKAYPVDGYRDGDNLWESLGQLMPNSEYSPTKKKWCLYIADSNIKVSLEIVIDIFWFNDLLWIEYDILLFQIGREKVQRFLLHGIIHSQKTMTHAGRHIIVLLDCYRLFGFHEVGLCCLLGIWLTSHEEWVHLLLFFSSTVHHL